MRILLVHNSYREPGGEDVVFEQERSLLENAGHQVFTYRRSNSELDAHSRLRQAIDCARSVWAPDVHRDLARFLRAEKIDVVHIHNTFVMISPSIYSACRAARVPVVQTIHNFRLLCPSGNFLQKGRICEVCASRSPLYALPHRCYRNSYLATGALVFTLMLHRQLGTWSQYVDQFILLSDFAKKKFVHCGFPNRKLTVKPNFMYPDPGERTWPGHYALYVGRLSPEKGILTLASTWRLLRNKLPLLIVGDGPLRSELQNWCQSSTVTLLGRRERHDCISLMKDASFLIVPSEGYESFPMAIIEAFACGVPVIASRIGSLPEIVKDAETGLTFRAGDVEDLRDTIDCAISNPELMRQMGRAARREFEAKYTASRNLSQLMEIYDQANLNKCERPEHFEPHSDSEPQTTVCP